MRKCRQIDIYIHKVIPYKVLFPSFSYTNMAWTSISAHRPALHHEFLVAGSRAACCLDRFPHTGC